jgi:hypothetical protein
VIGGTLTAPRPSGKAKQDDARRTLAYIASVALLQALFRVLNRRESQLAIVVFMLAIAVLINPPGLDIQSFIYCRFQQRNLERRSRT